jgi:dTDP-4-amino-4,6-dideoxygalactose transaminase
MKLQVPFNDLSRLEEGLRDEISKKAAQISSSGNYILGPEVTAFEKDLAQYLSVQDCVGVASGTDALILSLLALGIGPTDTVLTMANAGSYTTIAAKAVGAEPVFVDVSEDSLQMTLQELKKSLDRASEAGPSPKAVVVTHLFGQLNHEIQDIVRFSKQSGLFVIEDCAQSLGACSATGKAGSFGDLATFSFYPTKNLGASGDGGAVACSSAELATKLRKLRQYGWQAKYSIDLEGGRNSRLDEIQAAILRLKLPYLNGWNQKRREIYMRYREAASSSITFVCSTDTTFVAHLVPLVVVGMSQSQLAGYFTKEGIQTSIHFPTPDHKQAIELQYRNLVLLPVTEKSCSSLITLPIFPEMTESEITKVCRALSRLGA